MLGRLTFYYIFTGFKSHVLIMKVSDWERFECREKMVNVMGDIQTFLDVCKDMWKFLGAFQASEKQLKRSACFYFSVGPMLYSS